MNVFDETHIMDTPFADELAARWAFASSATFQKVNNALAEIVFFFADRHAHTWLKRIDRNKISLGSGKRMLVRGGRYEAKYMITVPSDLDDANI